MAKEIPLTEGFVAVVDDEDYEFLMRFKWRVLRNKRTGKVYAVTTMFMHRLVLTPPKEVLVDHRDRDGLNNTRANLRPATIAQNNQNQSRARSKVPYRGVQFNPGGRSRRWRGRWKASITADGKRIHLGCFRTPEIAARAYDAAARKYHGEFAVLNFPDDPPPTAMVESHQPATRE